MSLLLDTHIWIWALAEPSKLHRRVLNALRKPGAELWLSPISIWEFLVLAGAGKIAVVGDRFAWVANALATLPVREATLNGAVATESEKLALQHRDPADRFIAASAKVYGLTLVTADRRLIAAPTLSVLSNR